MADVRLSEDARLDLIDIDAFGAKQFGSEVSDAYQRSIAEVLDRLGDFPRIGEARPDYGIGIRCIVHKSHRILYRLTEDQVVIARILHHSRDVPRHLPE